MERIDEAKTKLSDQEYEDMLITYRARGFKDKSDYERIIVAKAVSDHPGMTSKELAVEANLDRFMVARRLPEITGVKRGDIREC